MMLRVVALAVVVVVHGFAALAQEPGAKIEFNRDIRPILSDACFKCHGFDKNARQADLRLHLPEGALAPRDAGPPIVPFDPAASQLYRRITSDNPDERMPPPGALRTPPAN